MSKISILMLVLMLVVGTIPTASAVSTLSVGAISYDSTVVKDESITVTSSVTASSVSGTLTVDVTLTDNSGLFTIPTPTQQLQFTTDGTKAISWTITATSTGTNAAPFTISASGDDGGFGSKTSASVITVKDRPIITATLSSSASSVVAGDSVVLSYVVSNSASAGAADATGVTATLTLPSGWSTTDTNPYSLGTIAPAASKSGSWTVTATSPAASNTFTLSAASTIPGGTVTNTLLITGPSTSTTESSSGSAGAAGGASEESFENIDVKDVAKVYVVVNTEAEYTFTEEENPIDIVEFKSLVTAGYTNVLVEVLKDTSNLVSTAPPGKVYKNINIWVGSGGWASSKTIANPKISFSVDKSWISGNDIDPATVKLLRYTTEWTELKTTKTSDDADKVYYSAETPGFSPFAITALTEDGEEITSDASDIETDVDGSIISEESAEPEDDEDESGGLPGFEAVIAIGLLGAAYYVHKRRV